MADEDESKLFSLTEAERLRTQVEPILIEAMESRRKMAEFEEKLAKLAERIQRSGGMQVNYEGIAQWRIERNQLEDSVRGGHRSHPFDGVHREGSRRGPAGFSVAHQ